METKALIADIDREIAKFQKAREVLLGLSTTEVKAKRGRPKNSGKKAAPKKRSLSPEARAKIAAAQKKRWAAAKKTV